MNRILNTILIFWIIWAGFFVIFNFFQESKVLAYTAKGEGGSIYAVEDWNHLADDFVKKEGDTMTGDLNMDDGTAKHYITGLATPTTIDSNFLANVAYISALSGKGAKDRTGIELNIICDSTTPGASGWYNVSNKDRVDIDTRSSVGIANFTSTPFYFVSLGGDNHMWEYDNMAIRDATAEGFKVVTTLNYSPVNLENWNWHINWCGVGN